VEEILAEAAETDAREDELPQAQLHRSLRPSSAHWLTARISLTEPR
jgi:hypothetical protein